MGTINITNYVNNVRDKAVRQALQAIIAQIRADAVTNKTAIEAVIASYRADAAANRTVFNDHRHKVATSTATVKSKYSGKPCTSGTLATGTATAFVHTVPTKTWAQSLAV